MNTIIIHRNNRVPRTPEHALSDILIAPVSPWYRKPTPWWVDKFEEVGLYPIVEADEIVEEVEETEEQEESLEDIVLDDEQVEGVDLADEVIASENVEYTSTDIALEHSSIDGADVFGDIALDDIIFDNDMHGMQKDRCCDNIDFFEDVILVDEVDNDDEEAEDEDDEDYTLTDITFTGRNATFRLPVPVRFVEDYEWHDKAMLSNVVTELDSEDEGEGDIIDWNCETNQFLQ